VSNKTIGFNAQYEVINNAYALINVAYSDIRGGSLKSATIPGEVVPPTGYTGTTEQFYLDLFTPKYLQGKHTTVTVGFSFGF